MKLYRTLANGLLESHSEDAARVLESIAESDAVAILDAAPAAVAAPVLRRMTPHRAAALLAKLTPERAGQIVEKLELDFAANVVRRMTAREPVLDAVTNELAQSLKSMLRFPEGTAGSFMDPNVLALPADLTAQQAVAHVREHPEHVRYTIYVVDRENLLVGVLNLRELLVAKPKDSLRSIAHPNVQAIPAMADGHTLVTHPIWSRARSVPVVDERGIYLGAIRYPTMRDLERRADRNELAGNSTIEALGELYSTGIASVFAALAAGAAAQPSPRNANRET